MWGAFTDNAGSQSLISVLHANARSVMPTRDELSYFIASWDAYIVLLSKTWLQPDVNDSEIFPDHRHFNIYRRDTANRRGGGVLIAASRRIASRKVLIHSALEIV